MQITERIKALVDRASKLKTSGQTMGEAQTKATFIQPMLETLGWDITDPDEVILEYKVFGGTLLDYALLIDGSPRLYLEAKRLGASLDDPAFITQTVNYASNDGIRWCVLTNGLVYRIYKTDELAPADKKLLAEVDLRETQDAESMAHAAQGLETLSKESIAADKLDEWGERVFVDVAVRDVLDSLLRDQSQGLVNLIRKVIGEEKYSMKQIRASLTRQAHQGPVKLPPPAPTPGPGLGGSPYTLEHHLAGKPQAIVDLFHQVDAKLMGLGPDISVRYLKYYVSYTRGKRSVVSVHLWQSRIDLFASMPFKEAPVLPIDRVRDVSKIGHLGLGDVEYRMYGPEDIKAAVALASASYLRAAQH
ncbi:MAG TPA: hypothetical protein DIU14_02735 [Actinobacteria bacterium]|jgi:predicted transport protein|nr:hypothetical protein [Actinomycetota bacterium]